jgi:hypothetical protein
MPENPLALYSRCRFPPLGQSQQCYDQHPTNSARISPAPRTLQSSPALADRWRWPGR